MGEVGARPGTDDEDTAPVPGDLPVVEGAPVPPEELRVRPHQVLALGVSLVFVALGLAGWSVTGASGWTERHGAQLLGLGLNPLHNVVHLTVGAAGLLLWRRPGGVRGFGLLLAVGYGLLSVYGLVAHGATWDVLALDAADNAMHLVAALLGVAIAVWPRPRPVDSALRKY